MMVLNLTQHKKEYAAVKLTDAIIQNTHARTHARTHTHTHTHNRLTAFGQGLPG